MKYFLRSLLIGLLCLAPLSTDATQRVAALISPQAINVDLGFVQVGNVGNLSVMGAPSGAIFSLLTNPGGHFSIVGTEIVAEPSTPSGQYSLSIQATGTGYSVSKTFVLNFSGVTPPTPHFFLGINISGAQNQFATFASNAELDYWKTHNVTEIRLPIGWSTVNSSYATGFSGIQPVSFGALDTTSTNYNGQSYVAALTAVINHAAANGQHIYLDMHSFGCVFSTCPGTGSIGSAGLPISAFVDVWTKIVTQFMGNPGFGGIDLMNEWVIGSSSIIQDAQQQAITGVRALGWTGKIYVEGANFTGAWNWVSGQNGIGGSNSANLYQIFDPANNIVFETHSYLDNDSSGSNFAWALEIAKSGLSPPGSPTSATIGPTRLNREIIPWSQSHNVRLNLGETGNSADYLALGGADNWQAWTTATKNEIDLCVANNIEVFMWGPGFSADYGFNPEPSNILNPSLVDFSSAGLQAMQMALIDQYTGYSGAAPLAYRVDLPITTTATGNPEAPSISKNPYASVGSPSGNFTVRYGGKITSPVTITPHATLMDGTSGGGTFAPATIVLAAGNNAIANFTYTPSQAATFKISTTNNAGWIPPPALGFSSVNDSYVSLLPNLPSNEYGMFNRYTPNIGPAVRLQRSTDNQQMDWYFTLAGEGGYLGFDRAAIQTWASARSGITVIRHYDESPSGNHIIFNRGGNFLGAIVGTTLTVSDGSGIAAGQTLLDNSFAVPANVHVVSGSGTTWTLDTSLNISSEQMFTASTSGVALATLNLSNANDYPEITDPSTSSSILRGVFNVPFAGQTQMSVIARMDQTGSPTAGLFRTDHFTGPLNWSNANIQFARTGWVGPTNLTSAAVIATTNLNVTNGTYGDYGYVYNANSTTGHKTYKDGSVTTSQTSVLTSFTGTGSGTNLTTTSVTGSILPTDGVFGNGVPPGTYIVSQTSGTTGGAGVYVTSQATTSAGDALQTSSIMNPAFSDGTTTLGWFQFASTFWSGAYTNLEFLPFLINDTQVGTIMSADGTYYSTPLPDVLPGIPPTVTNVVANQPTFPSRYPSYPFSTVLIADSNSGSPTESVTITLSGAAGTLSGSGISGSGPYTIASGTPTAVSLVLQGALFTPGTSTPGNTTTFTTVVTSSAGSSSTVSPSAIITTYVAETPFSAPVGTFTPVNHSGVNLAGGENVSSGLPNGQFPACFEYQYFAGKGFGLTRLAFTSGNFSGATPGIVNTNFGLLNSAFTTQIKSALDCAFALNMYVVLDVHDYGGTRYQGLTTLNTTSGAPIAPNTTAEYLFVDLETRLATLFKNYPNAVFGLMNEPSRSFLTGGGVTAAQWVTCVSAAVTSMRAAGATQLITLPGVAFAHAKDWVTSGSAAAYTGFSADTLNNFVFEAHQYLDSGQVGNTPVATINGATVLVDMNTWLAANGYKGVIYEFGIGWDPWFPQSGNVLSYDPSHATTLTTNSVTQNTAMLNYMVSNSANWMGWTAWAGGIEFSAPATNGGYGFNPEPMRANGGTSNTAYQLPIVDQPQLPVLQGNILWLLKRDLDPSSNDNSPMWLEKAA